MAAERGLSAKYLAAVWEMVTGTNIDGILLVHTTQPELSRGMQRLLGRYAQAFNDRHRRFGHLFAGRFADEFALSASLTDHDEVKAVFAAGSSGKANSTRVTRSSGWLPAQW